MREALSPDDVGLVTGLVVMSEDLDTVNAAGNPVHYLGISWGGGYGDRVAKHAVAREVASVSGALFAVRRPVWDRLGGLDPAYFLYHEDADLSLRAHLAGLRVLYCPEAMVSHAYAFDKNPQKLYLLERNRLVTVLTTYPTPLLVRVLPMLLLTEPLILALAAIQGWGTAKLRAWGWVVSNSTLLLARRRRVQAAAVVPWRELAMSLSARIDPGPAEAPPAMDLLNALLKAYWRSLGLSKDGPPDG
jgi:GT2 family glycosyltransferase